MLLLKGLCVRDGCGSAAWRNDAYSCCVHTPGHRVPRPWDLTWGQQGTSTENPYGSTDKVLDQSALWGQRSRGLSPGTL